MLTRSGWIVAGAAVLLVVAGRLFGIFELFLVGAGAAALAAVAVVVVRRTCLRLEVARQLHPPRVHAGSPSRVELRVRNRGTLRTPLLGLRDPVGSGRSARVVLAPLGRDEVVRAAYRLPTEARGILTVGPLAVEVTDPFGLASLATPAAPKAELTVWPAIDDITPLPHTSGDDPHGGADHPNTLSTAGDDFYALRPYTVGDDLRRVHWRTTARRDELTVRQDEMPWQGRSTVLLDTRRAAHSPATFERAVSAAASVIVACAHRRHLLRLLTTAGQDSGFGAGSAHVEAIMEHLAAVRLVEAGRLGVVLASLQRRGGGGALAALVGGRASADFDALARLRPLFPSLTVVAFVRGVAGEVDARPSSHNPSSRPAGALVIDEDTEFAPRWDEAMQARGARRPVGAPRP